MTREDAIKVLRTESIELGGSAPSVCRFWEALDMAVKALEDVTGKDVGKWISVKDRLPEMSEHYRSEDVLVCIDYRQDDPDTTEDTYVSIDYVAFNCFGQGEFSCERDDPRDGEPSPYFVTHWMPLPEPPEEVTV